MEIQAALHRLHLYSPDPLKVACFYSSTYEMAMTSTPEGYRCSGLGRALEVSEGPVNQLRYAHFALNTEGAWDAFAARVSGLKQQALPSAFTGHGHAVALQDPVSNLVVFTPPIVGSQGLESTVVPPASLQHFALRTSKLPAMMDFYVNSLGFVLSDAVKDAEGELRACFLRTDFLHHALALFSAPVTCFDHQSFEAPDWASMKDWGDHMAALQVPIVWGIGRHGPGNDVFFMVRDPDGNLAEISSEIEHCATGRTAGEWRHEERTLNLWGKAILRS
jgi:catechol 2,3-dioxygenase-like lactoylglutathione lyase family enzyme